MDRVTEKLKQAAGVVARSNAGLEAEADKLIAREAQFEERKVAAFAPHYRVLDNRNREMDQLEDSLKIVSNQDPLDDSEKLAEKPKQELVVDKAEDKAALRAELEQRLDNLMLRSPEVGQDTTTGFPDK